ncbi:ADP-ribosylation factor [Physcomitrium patens]|uniref:Uncharacterized protein n=1 Tax=Physcomitrium patens TaxID=3218 RepID=A9RW24_PHYPA|nr:ADP-ribosylation factor-like [Physcomitrium patens]PNR47229.1 hypothetical protein PHYPA_014349 [Physcomitrium patens]|eukprot:XP_024386204.1 ADP-ribosylation factor-like [Physcomitrella patens]
MGQVVAKLLSSILWPSKQLAILMLGLDNAGKTTLLYKLKLGEKVITVPTIGFNVESIQYRNVNFTVWDVGGQDKIRPLWKYYFDNAQGLIFVVDSNDRERLLEARDELQRLLAEPDLRVAKVLVFANKQDLPYAANVAEVTNKLGLLAMREPQWFVQGCCGTTGEGLHEGLEWLAAALRDAS